jgi:sulfite oxidase
MQGYAYSGGGRGIIRVDVSIDGGKSWNTATLTEGSDQPIDKAWAWTFWEIDVDIPESMASSDIEVL